MPRSQTTSFTLFLTSNFTALDALYTTVYSYYNGQSGSPQTRKCGLDSCWRKRFVLVSIYVRQVFNNLHTSVGLLVIKYYDFPLTSLISLSSIKNKATFQLTFCIILSTYIINIIKEYHNLLCFRSQTTSFTLLLYKCDHVICLYSFWKLNCLKFLCSKYRSRNENRLNLEDM